MKARWIEGEGGRGGEEAEKVCEKGKVEESARNRERGDEGGGKREVREEKSD